MTAVKVRVTSDPFPSSCSTVSSATRSAAGRMTQSRRPWSSNTRPEMLIGDHSPE